MTPALVPDMTATKGNPMTDFTSARRAMLEKSAARVLRGKPALWQVAAFRGSIGVPGLVRQFANLDDALAYVSELLSGDITSAQVALDPSVDPDLDTWSEIRIA